MYHQSPQCSCLPAPGCLVFLNPKDVWFWKHFDRNVSNVSKYDDVPPVTTVQCSFSQHLIAVGCPKTQSLHAGSYFYIKVWEYVVLKASAWSQPFSWHWLLVKMPEGIKKRTAFSNLDPLPKLRWAILVPGWGPALAFCGCYWGWGGWRAY